MISSVTHLSGLREMADRFDVFFLDIWGLLHNGVTLYPGTITCLEELNKAGKQICLVSNTPRLPQNVFSDLQKLGLNRGLYHDAVTAGLSARLDLERNYAGKKAWFAGKSYFQDLLLSLDISLVERPEDSDLIVNAIAGITPGDDASVYEILSRGIATNKPMLCANPDIVVHVGGELYNCAGMYAAWYEKQGGHVTYHGKPHPEIYRLALERMGNPDTGKVCALGDVLHTDIQGACRMGIAGIWVLGGIHWEELRITEKPDHPDLDRVAETIKISPHKPIATLTQFSW